MTKARLNIVSRREMMLGELYRALSRVLDHSSQSEQIFISTMFYTSQSHRQFLPASTKLPSSQLKLSNARQRPKVGSAQGVVFQDKMVQTHTRLN